MAATPESKVKAKIKLMLLERHIYYAMPIGTGYGNAGVPDFLCCVNGHFFAIEAKTKANKPTALQEKHLSAIRSCNGYAMVVNEDNLKELEQWLTELGKQSK